MPELITIGETMAVMSPKEQGPLRYVSEYKLRMAGAESNVAVGLCKLGHTAGWISRVGEDEMGAYVLNAVRAEGVDCSRVIVDEDHRTGLMLKEMGTGETKVYYYRENSAASHLCSKDLDKRYLSKAKIIHLTGITPVLSKSCEGAVVSMAAYAKQKGILLSFDPNIRKKLWKDKDYNSLMQALLFMSDIALLGRDEAYQIMGTNEPEEIIDRLREEGVRYIGLKDGGNGAWVADHDSIEFVAPYPCRTIDPIGAGDAFNAAFLAGILEGRSLLECGRMAAIAGALATETPGDIEGYPSMKQLQRKLDSGIEIYR
ncbi:MAG: sugar kinase [Firmicutes bacterium]|nr:sugar kinase [Bacillota bacterium]